MDNDVGLAMMSASLQQFHDGTVIYDELQEDFIREMDAQHAFLGMWFLDQLLHNQFLMNDELSDYRDRWEQWLKAHDQEWGEDPKIREKLKWTFDIFLMEMGSNYIKDYV